jgi:TP901 family phage tail tape measure protein
MGTKSAFQLSNDKVAHIGDVLSCDEQTAADFDGLSDSLTYAAPVAKNAGVSIEQPPRWLARFMTPKSPAQWLGPAAVPC